MVLALRDAAAPGQRAAAAAARVVVVAAAAAVLAGEAERVADQRGRATAGRLTWKKVQRISL